MSTRKEIHEGSARICPRCGELLDFEEFGVDRSRWDGVAVYCKLCNRRRRPSARKVQAQESNGTR